jgi:hypothetical protein
MTKPHDLDELASRVESASGPDRELSAEIALAIHDWLHEAEGNKPLNCRIRNSLGSPVYIGGETGRAMDYTASLDAAIALMTEDCIVTIGGGLGIGTAAIEASGNIFASKAATPALALTAAALRARASLTRSLGGG